MNLFEEIDRLIEWQVPDKSPTVEMNQDCFRCILGGDDDARDKFITSNIRLITSALASFLTRHPKAIYLIDDLFSSALCRLTEATDVLINRAKKDEEKFWNTVGALNEDDEWRAIAYIYICIYKRIQKTYEIDSLEPISQRGKERTTPEGEDQPIKRKEVCDAVFEDIPHDHFSVRTIYQDIMELCWNSKEREIIRRKVDKTCNEVAKDMGLSTQTVMRTRDDIYLRYLQKYGHPPQP